MSNADVLRRACVPELSATLRQKRLAMIGHTLLEDLRLQTASAPRHPLALSFLHPPREMLRRGQANTVTLIRTIQSDLDSLNLSVNDVARMPKTNFRWSVRS